VLVNQVFEAWLFPDPISALNDLNYPYAEGENITEGILNVDITFGNDIYEGPQQQIDTGQFTIVSRNPNLDPKINPNLKYDSTIKFYDTRSGEFFRGFVTDIQVEYQREDNPIITITGTDIFGAMQRVVIDQETHDAIVALSTGPNWNGITFTEFMPYMIDFTSKYLEIDGITPPGYPYPYGFWFPATSSFGEINVDALSYSPAKYIPEVGETYLDVITKYAQTNLNSFNAKSGFGGAMDFNFVGVKPFVKYNPNYWYPQTDPEIYLPNPTFSFDPADDRPYESILLDNGYNRVINQIDISNESRYIDAGEIKSETLNFTRTSAESIENYAISNASVSTIFPESDATPEADWATDYAQNIFQVVQFPAQEIKQITFDNARKQMIEDDFTYSNYGIDDNVRIKHQIDNNEIINRIYDISGVNHNISPNNWSMTFSLKPSEEEIAYLAQGSTPTLQMNATSGDSNFNFTATIAGIDVNTVDEVIWALSATDANEVQAIWPYAVGGYMFKNGLPRTGLTQTWNFDDDGILEPYSFDGDSTPTNILDNRYGGYGVGIWYVYAFIKLTNGFRVVIQQQLTVGTPAVEADFGWSQNLTNNFGQVSFTDTSVNHEIGEPDSYVWNFGDGTTSTQRNPIKVYDPAPGQTTYSVSLTVFAYGSGGTKVYDTHTETVTLVQPTMTANFTSSANGTVVTFTNTSTNVGFEEPDAYLWDFGDGTISTQKNPVKTFAGQAGSSTTYTVTLTTRNIWEQTATVTKNVTIAPLYDTGTQPVNLINLQTGVWTDQGTPIMSYLKCLRSDGSNLSFNASTSISNYSTQTWWSQLGTAAPQTSTNLTRNPSTSGGNYGLQFRGGTPANFTLVTGIPTTYNIKNINMLFDDKYPAATYPATSWDRVYVVIPDSVGGSYPVGYFELPPIPNFAPRQTFGREYSMTPIRPMPPQIPYFKYTFNNRTVSFTSVETADSYLWTFGDGTTSTLKDPVKTYAARGTYTVSLAVTNNGIVTRTTTEPVIVEALSSHPVRYIKFVQKEHTGINAWDTPFVSTLEARYNRNSYVQTNPASPKTYIAPTTFAKTEGYSMQWIRGTADTNPPTTMNPTISPDNTRLFSGGGLRVKSLDATFRTQWELIGDFGTAISNISDFRAFFSRWSNYDGTPNPVCAGISYEVYITNYTGTQAGIGTATWTKIGDFTPTNMPLNVEKLYTMTPL
jgi:PKD repeat protein